MEKNRSAFKFLSLLLIFGVGIALQAYAQRVEKQKSITKKYDARTNKPLIINNKYGIVHINTTDGNEIEVEITMRAWANNVKLAEEVLKSIQVEIDEGNTLNPLSPINFETQVAMSGKGENNFEVNYQITMPKRNDLTVSNKYGHTYLGEHNGTLLMDIKYGSLKTEKIAGTKDKNITVSYGSADINFIEQGTISLKHSSLNLESATNITIKNSYSKVDIQAVESLNLICEYGQMQINTAKNISGQSSYTDFQLGNLSKKLQLSLNYNSDFVIDKIEKGFESVKIDGQYSDCNLGFEEGNTFQFAVNLHFAELMTDKTKIKLTRQEKNSNTNTNIYEGNYGSNNLKSKVVINSKYGNVNFH